MLLDKIKKSKIKKNRLATITATWCVIADVDNSNIFLMEVISFCLPIFHINLGRHVCLLTVTILNGVLFDFSTQLKYRYCEAIVVAQIPAFDTISQWIRFSLNDWLYATRHLQKPITASHRPRIFRVRVYLYAFFLIYSILCVLCNSLTMLSTHFAFLYLPPRANFDRLLLLLLYIYF